MRAVLNNGTFETNCIYIGLDEGVLEAIRFSLKKDNINKFAVGAFLKELQFRGIYIKGLNFEEYEHGMPDDTIAPFHGVPIV